MEILDKIKIIKESRLTREEILLHELFDDCLIKNSVENCYDIGLIPILDKEYNFITVLNNNEILLKYNTDEKTCYIGYTDVFKRIRINSNDNTTHDLIIKFIENRFGFVILRYEYVNYFG